jgi:hypothetical protein
MRSRPALFLLAAFLLLAHAQGLAQQTVWTGVVRDSATGEPINGASIRVQGGNTGTYSRSGGTFRLPMPTATYTISVRSVGYGERSLKITPAQTSLDVRLPMQSVLKNSVTVVGDISAEEVIRRAVARKNENAARITSLESSTYSKLRMDLGLTGLTDEERAMIMETFSKIYEVRRPTPKKHIVLLQRRQTKNIGAENNLAVFDDFFDFTRDEVTILNTTLITPLGADALDEYAYTIVSKRSLGQQMVYEIAFQPKARIFPGFEGTLMIVEGTYQIIDAKFAPTEETAFPLLKDLRYEQHYDNVSDSVWVPTYQQVSAGLELTVVVGLLKVNANVVANTYVTDVVVNKPIADSLLVPEAPTTISVDVKTRGGKPRSRVGVDDPNMTIAPDVDSAKPEFWDQHAFAEQTEEEKRVYREQDSITAEETKKPRDSSFALSKGSLGGLGFSINVYANRTPLTGALIGGELGLSYAAFSVKGMAAFGQQGTRAGMASLTWNAIDTDDVKLQFSGGVFSQYRTLQESRSISRRFSSLNLTNLLYAGYYDFFRQDGFDVGTQYSVGRFTASMLYTQARVVPSNVLYPPDRPVLSADPGNYSTLSATIDLGAPTLMDNIMGTGWPVRGSVTGQYGLEHTSQRTFTTVEASIGSTIPTFTTGYRPMTLDISVHAGWSSDNTPAQYRYYAMKRFPVFGTVTDLATVPVNALIGSSYVAVHAEHNFSDMWWRIVGLPTYNKRGPDLIGIFNAATYSAQWYTEAGVALARIPSFISDLLYLRVDVLWPVGPYATQIGRFGWSIGVSSPLL